MRRRRATPRSTGRAGRSSVPPYSGTGRAFEDSEFPIDDLPPEDLPVRDITDDLDEPHLAPNVAIQAVDQGVKIPLSLLIVPKRTVPSPSTLHSVPITPC